MSEKRPNFDYNRKNIKYLENLSFSVFRYFEMGIFQTLCLDVKIP